MCGTAGEIPDRDSHANHFTSALGWNEGQHTEFPLWSRWHNHNHGRLALQRQSHSFLRECGQSRLLTCQ